MRTVTVPGTGGCGAGSYQPYASRVAVARLLVKAARIQAEVKARHGDLGLFGELHEGVAELSYPRPSGLRPDQVCAAERPECWQCDGASGS
jgi:hypothetical protein